MYLKAIAKRAIAAANKFFGKGKGNSTRYKSPFKSEDICRETEELNAEARREFLDLYERHSSGTAGSAKAGTKDS